MNDEKKHGIIGFLLGVLTTSIFFLFPIQEILTYYTLGLIPSLVVILIAVVLGAIEKHEKDKKKNLINESSQKKSGIVLKMIKNKLNNKFVFIVFWGSWLTFFIISYQLIEFIILKSKKKN